MVFVCRYLGVKQRRNTSNYGLRAHHKGTRPHDLLFIQCARHYLLFVTFQYHPDVIRSLEFIIGVNDAVVYVSASHARGPWFESQRLHSSFSLKSSDFVPVAPGGYLEWCKRELKSILYII